MAERTAQTIKQGIRKLKGGSLESRLYRFLLGYNVTPQATTGVAHSIALMGRRLRRRLDLVVPDVGSRVREKQGKMKQYHDDKVKDRTFYVGDPVYAKNFCGTGRYTKMDTRCQ